MTKTKKEANAFVSRHIRRHKKMGMKQDQAVAVALTEAREKGYPVKNPPGIARLEKRP
jgi:hypothetical protein